MPTSSDTKEQVSEYYRQADNAYRNWGRDPILKGLYGIHCGFYLPGSNIDHHTAVKELVSRLIQFADIPSRGRVLDAGCGVGSISFEVAQQLPTCTVLGVNISEEQLKVAHDLVNRYNFRNVSFSRQDYLSLGLRSQSFDTMIFCESFTHAMDKKVLSSEVARVLKLNGNIIIADVFLNTNEPTEEDVTDLERVSKGWVLPDIVECSKYRSILLEIGFNDIRMVDITRNIYPSFKLMASHAQMRLDQEAGTTSVIQYSREACVSALKLVDRKTVGYYFVKARLSQCLG